MSPLPKHPKPKLYKNSEILQPLTRKPIFLRPKCELPKFVAQSPKPIASFMLQEIEKYSQPGINKMLVGNKCDPRPAWHQILRDLEMGLLCPHVSLEAPRPKP